MSRMLNRLGRIAARRPWVTIGVWLVLAVAVIATSTGAGRELRDTNNVPGLDSQRAVDLLAAAGSESAGLTAQVVVTPRDAGATFFDSASARDALTEVQRSLGGLPQVLTVTDPAGALTQGRQTAAAAGGVSPDGRVAVVRIQYPLREQLAAGNLTDLKGVVARAGGDVLRVEAGGDLFFAFEEPAMGMGEAIGLLAAIVILLLAFGSVVAMGLPIGMALFGLGLGISAMSLVTYLVEIPVFAPVMASMVGLGVGIDYALFIVARHREHLAAGMGVVESVGLAVASAGQAVVFAGGTVVVSILGLAVAGIPMVTAAGIAISLVVFIMVAGSLTLIPAFLGLVGHRINSLRMPSPGRRRHDGGEPTDAGWRRWGGHVARHPVAYVLSGVALLLALAAPVVALRLGVPDDGTLPESRTERRAYDLVASGFGPGVNGPLLIAVDISNDASVVGPVAQAVAADPGIASVESPEIATAAGVATIVATPTTAPQDAATRATVERLRAQVFPAALGDSPATAHIGGQTANFSDMSERVQDRLLAFIAAVVGLSFLLLLVVFRSILVPLKAAVLNLLSIGAAYGVLVMVFQWGWGAGLIGLESTVPIVSFIPLLMFAIVFGLSMDYEVFLLSRIREHYVATGDSDASVVAGLAGTARVITSAALIMISVFLGFVFGNDPTIKMLGLGLATAIFVDATIVRMVLVPAAMALLGNANWWLPAWLDRLLPRFTPEAHGGREQGPHEAGALSPVRQAS